MALTDHELRRRTSDELLAIICEESSDVIKEACKAQRFGLDSSHPDEPEEGTNLTRLVREFEQLERAVSVLKKRVYEVHTEKLKGRDVL